MLKLLFTLLAVAALLPTHPLPAQEGQLLDGVATLVDQIEDAVTGFPQVHRVQLVMRTSARRGASTDDWVEVSLSPQHRTWLATPRDDLERGKTETFDLMIMDDQFKNPLRTLNEIQHLQITKFGPDHWAVLWFELWVNNVRVYRHDFGGRHWFRPDQKNVSTYTISKAELQASPEWQAWRPKLPSFHVTNAELVARLEGIVGDQVLYNSSGRWGSVRWGRGKGVKLTAISNDMIRLHLDFEYNCITAPDFNVDADIQIVQFADRLEFRVARLQINGGNVTGNLAVGIARNEGKKAVRGLLGSDRAAAVRFKKQPFFFRVRPAGGVELVFGLRNSTTEAELWQNDIRQAAQAREQERQARAWQNDPQNPEYYRSRGMFVP